MNFDFPALSVRQPWCFAILILGKTIENRERCAFRNYRGPIYLHAAKGMTWAEHVQAAQFIHRVTDKYIPGYDEFRGGRSTYTVSVQRGGLVGRARIVDCIDPGRWHDPPNKHPLASNKWYTGDYGLVLEDIETLPAFIPCPGQLGLWKVPADVLEKVRAA